ncbi:hypothetical protein AeNC1_015280 [Aphanomyces euteiches]|nr:hypothetical protein AeNC1_015280 [Aphanomyces euteiches]
MFHKLARSLTRWTSKGKRSASQSDQIPAQELRLLLNQLERNWRCYRQQSKAVSGAWDDAVSMYSVDSEASRVTEMTWAEDENKTLVDALRRCIYRRRERAASNASSVLEVSSVREAWV